MADDSVTNCDTRQAYRPSLRIDPANTAQLRASSLPTKSAKYTAQLAQMRKLVMDADLDRLGAFNDAV
ncbi:MAG: hypothetical protein INR71_13355 [Terriglobus roseus]|nr:hypothetical protein [Terriglobus roseus]